MEIKRYSSVCEGEWNAFVERSRQGTFLFNRGYMDYHSDRFDDFSLMAYDRGVLKGVLPANRVGNVLYSHQGLTYGGWILPQRHFDASDFLCLWNVWLDHCREEGYDEVFTSRFLAFIT